MRRFTVAIGFVLSFGLLTTACDTELAGPEKGSVPDGTVKTQEEAPSNAGLQGLDAVRITTEEYKDLNEAKADGYKLFSPFVPEMGFHYLHESAINEDGSSSLDRRLNRTKPEVLVYSDKTEGNSGQFAPHNEGFAAVEYAIPKREGETEPPQHAVALFNNADAHDWHVHPSSHELGLPHGWTVHGECHYESGAGVFLAEDPAGDFLLLTPQGQVGTWNGSVEPSQCPALPGETLRIVHGKWWTLHAWIWVENPEGVFHSTNLDVQS